MLIVIFILAVIAVAGVICAVWYDLNIGFEAPAHPDFNGYTTTTELNGSSIKSTSLTRYKEYAMDIWGFDYVLNYDSGVTVYERNVGKYPDVVASCKSQVTGKSGEYDYSCDVYSLANGGRYTVVTSTYKNKLAHISVEAVIGTTRFSVNIPENQLQNYANYDGWKAYFDTLQPVDLQKMPFTIKTHHQGGA